MNPSAPRSSALYQFWSSSMFRICEQDRRATQPRRGGGCPSACRAPAQLPSPFTEEGRALLKVTQAELEPAF